MPYNRSERDLNRQPRMAGDPVARANGKPADMAFDFQRLAETLASFICHALHRAIMHTGLHYRILRHGLISLCVAFRSDVVSFDSSFHKRYDLYRPHVPGGPI